MRTVQFPATLWPEPGQNALRCLQERIGSGMVAMSFQDLLTSLGCAGNFTREKMSTLARALESVGIGFEPDVLTGANIPKPEDKVVLFSLSPSRPSHSRLGMSSSACPADGHSPSARQALGGHRKTNSAPILALPPGTNRQSWQ